MGASESENLTDSITQNKNNKFWVKVVIILLLGLFSPIMIVTVFLGFFPSPVVMSLFWTYNPDSYMASFFGFSLVHPNTLVSAFPFLLLRMVPVFMMYLYYNEKTTRKRALMATLVGDGISVIIGILSLPGSITSGWMHYNIPLPFQLIVGLLILWRFPLPVPVTPFKEEKKSEVWWEEKD